MLLKSKKGVTVMEMLVVLVIIGMLSLMAMPTFFAFTKNARLKGAARVISSALRNARSYAITQRIVYTVTLYLTDNAISIYETSNTVKKIKASDPDIIDIRYDNGTTTDGYEEITFNPDGTATSSSFTSSSGIPSVRVYDIIGTGTTNVHFIEIRVYPATGSAKTSDIDTNI